MDSEKRSLINFVIVAIIVAVAICVFIAQYGVSTVDYIKSILSV